MPPSRLLPCMAAPVPNSWKARCFSSMVPETHLATPSSAGWSAIFTGILPRTAMALSRFEPMTAPIPVRPATSFRSLTMQAKRTRFSPAGPIWATRMRGSPSSARIASSTSPVIFPQRCAASRISTAPSLIQR